MLQSKIVFLAAVTWGEGTSWRKDFRLVGKAHYGVEGMAWEIEADGYIVSSVKNKSRQEMGQILEPQDQWPLPGRLHLLKFP